MVWQSSPVEKNENDVKLALANKHLVWNRHTNGKLILFLLTVWGTLVPWETLVLWGTLVQWGTFPYSVEISTINGEK